MTKHTKPSLSEYMGDNVKEPMEEFVPWPDEPQEEDPYAIYDPAAPSVPVFRTLSLTDIRNLPDPEWLVSKFLQADSFAVLYGAPGSTKSFWALDIALCVATGTPFHGSDVKKGQALYAAGEGLRGLKWRIESWLLAHPDATEEDVLSNLRIIPDVPHLLDKTHTAKLLNTAEIMAEEKTPLRLVIIDTWARALVGGDENSQKDSGLAVNACDIIRKNTGATTLVVHHTGTEGTRERGSTVLRGAADTSIMVAHDEMSRYTTVTVKKMKDGEAGHKSTYSLKQYGHSVVLAAANGLFDSADVKPVVRDRDYYMRRSQEARDSAF
jgi:RecA-family ATPase